jgi:hypothetical protein
VIFEEYDIPDLKTVDGVADHRREQRRLVQRQRRQPSGSRPIRLALARLERTLTSRAVGPQRRSNWCPNGV